jgi:hypothetical protein
LDITNTFFKNKEARAAFVIDMVGLEGHHSELTVGDEVPFETRHTPVSGLPGTQ